MALLRPLICFAVCQGIGPAVTPTIFTDPRTAHSTTLPTWNTGVWYSPSSSLLATAIRSPRSCEPRWTDSGLLSASQSGPSRCGGKLSLPQPHDIAKGRLSDLASSSCW